MRNEKTDGKKTVVRPPFGWPGGKRLLAPEIEKEIPVDHLTFVEVFCGAMHLTLLKERSDVEIVNDLNSDLVNFFEVVKDSPIQLLCAMQLHLYARETFKKYMYELADPEKELTPVERAVRFWYVVKTSFGSMRGTFGTSKKEKSRLNVVSVIDVIMRLHERLTGVCIESLDWRKVIVKYDSPETVFYLDPPYHVKSSPRLYGRALTDDDFRDLARTMREMKGRALLSINDDSFIREVFGEFQVQKLPVNYSINAKKSIKTHELLYRNF